MSRWATLRSVLRRSWPIVREPGVSALDRPSHPEGDDFGSVHNPSFCAVPSILGTNHVVDVALGTQSTNSSTVVAAIEVQSLDLTEQSTHVGCVESRRKENCVVTVGPVGGPTDRYALTVG